MRNFPETYHSNNIFLSQRAAGITVEKTRMCTQNSFIFYYQKYINIAINKKQKIKCSEKTFYLYNGLQRNWIHRR